jgi:hypothetical protein
MVQLCEVTGVPLQPVLATLFVVSQQVAVRVCEPEAPHAGEQPDHEP